METKTINLNNADFDKIRKQLGSDGLVYPPDSSDSRYREAFDLIKRFGCSIEVVSDYAFDTLGPETHPIAKKSQCRQGNVDPDWVQELCDRFSNGEELLNPIIGIMDDDGLFFPGFGNNRSRALKKAEISTTIIVVGGDLNLSDRIVLVSKLANISNKKTKDDVKIDTAEDIKFQMSQQWDLVENVDLDSTSPVSEAERKAYWEYYDLMEDDETAAEEYKKQYLFSWLLTDKDLFLSKNKEQARRSFSIHYADTFSTSIKQRLSPNYHQGKIPLTYNQFWSEIDPETGEETRLWDPSSNSYENDSRTVQQSFGGANPKQNSTRTMHHQAWLFKNTEYLEICVRPHQNLRDLKSLKSWRESILSHYKKWNNKRNKTNTGDLRYPVVSKIIFPQHFSTDDKDRAFEWTAGSNSGFYKEVFKKT